MDYSLLPEERETIIRWSRADDIATVYTSDTVTLTKVHRCAEADGSEWALKNVEKYNGRVIAETWEVPKNLISFRTKKVHREMTEEQKAIVGTRLKKGRINSMFQNH